MKDLNIQINNYNKIIISQMIPKRLHNHVNIFLYNMLNLIIQ